MNMNLNPYTEAEMVRHRYDALRDRIKQLESGIQEKTNG